VAPDSINFRPESCPRERLSTHFPAQNTDRINGHTLVSINSARLTISMAEATLAKHTRGPGAIPTMIEIGRLLQKELVGPPGFEPGTSCTPNTGLASLGPVASGVFCGLHGFGASASVRCRWRWIEFPAHFCAQSAMGGAEGIETAPWIARRFQRVQVSTLFQ
jgi:hypothetical protein